MHNLLEIKIMNSYVQATITTTYTHSPRLCLCCGNWLQEGQNDCPETDCNVCSNPEIGVGRFKRVMVLFRGDVLSPEYKEVVKAHAVLGLKTDEKLELVSN